MMRASWHQWAHCASRRRNERMQESQNSIPHCRLPHQLCHELPPVRPQSQDRMGTDNKRNGSKMARSWHRAMGSLAAWLGVILW